MMPPPSGFFRLRTPLDLLAKMEFDYQRLEAEPRNEYVAFDFFVTAAHLPEWLGKFRCSQQINGDKPKAMNAVCQHLASGAKHFTPGKHSAVRGTGVSTPAISGLARSGITISGLVQPNLLILLAPDEAKAIGVEAVTSLALASMLLTYWREHEGVKRAAAMVWPQDEQQ